MHVEGEREEKDICEYKIFYLTYFFFQSYLAKLLGLDGSSNDSDAKKVIGSKAVG